MLDVGFMVWFLFLIVIFRIHSISQSCRGEMNTTKKYQYLQNESLYRQTQETKVLFSFNAHVFCSSFKNICRMSESWSWTKAPTSLLSIRSSKSLSTFEILGVTDRLLTSYITVLTFGVKQSINDNDGLNFLLSNLNLSFQCITSKC
jgi:hypothetical protein